MSKIFSPLHTSASDFDEDDDQNRIKRSQKIKSALQDINNLEFMMSIFDTEFPNQVTFYKECAVIPTTSYGCD